jgi:hypothetical protein
VRREPNVARAFVSGVRRAGNAALKSARYGELCDRQPGADAGSFSDCEFVLSS